MSDGKPPDEQGVPTSGTSEDRNAERRPTLAVALVEEVAPNIIVQPTPVIIKDSGVFFAKVVPILTLVAAIVAAYFAAHTDIDDSRTRALAPKLALIFDNGTEALTVAGSYPNGVKTMQVHADVVLLNTGSKPASDAAVNIFAPGALRSPLPNMPGISGPAGALDFRRINPQSANAVSRAEANVPNVILRTNYDLGTFSFAAEPGIYTLDYNVTCAECGDITRGAITLTVIEPTATP